MSKRRVERVGGARFASSKMDDTHIRGEIRFTNENNSLNFSDRRIRMRNDDDDDVQDLISAHF